jgi:hypothetical protein
VRRDGGMTARQTLTAVANVMREAEGRRSVLARATRPSEVLGRPAPARDDARRWLRVALQALLVLANVAAAATLLAVALR